MSSGQETPELLTASIYARGNGPERLLYKFKRTATRSGSAVKVLREYTYPNGKLAASERVLYDGGSLKSYELEDLQTGARGSASIEQDPKNPARTNIAFQYARNNSDRAGSNVRREALREGTLVNDMVGPFLASHWQELQAGQSVRCQYIVVPRRETIGFSFKKDSDSKWRGQEVIVLKMQPANPIFSALVDALYFTLDKRPPHRVLQYEGRTTPKVRQGNSWKDLDAVTVFDW